MSTPVKLRRNETLYTYGQLDDSVYLITKGRIKALTLTRGGRGCLLDIYGKCDVMGESCLLGGQRGETAVAMVPSALLRMPRAWFLRALAQERMLEDYLRYLTKRLYEQQTIITHLVTADSEQRLAAT